MYRENSHLIGCTHCIDSVNLNLIRFTPVCRNWIHNGCSGESIDVFHGYTLFNTPQVSAYVQGKCAYCGAKLMFCVLTPLACNQIHISRESCYFHTHCLFGLSVGCQGAACKGKRGDGVTLHCPGKVTCDYNWRHKWLKWLPNVPKWETLIEYIDGNVTETSVDIHPDRAVMDNESGDLTILNLTASDGGRYMCDFICHERAEIELSIVREYFPVAYDPHITSLLRCMELYKSICIHIDTAEYHTSTMLNATHRQTSTTDDGDAGEEEEGWECLGCWGWGVGGWENGVMCRYTNMPLWHNVSYQLHTS